ncbi:CASP-like protein 4A1 isoform X2 [Manihot esculenta]|uniref:Uncharacterized protein n=1 Tax=Manihot esculenta TaxID=3983 RepID=A0ACB7G491_MANES|nr:CASP-like protein 4A1 isoform X2 [Manihot esculenta]KAG8635032.1 hypothetical protein MANES_17G121200v8 [Manihot esculenta]
MKTQENYQQQHSHVQEDDHDHQLPEEEEEEEEEEEPQLQELEKQRNHPIPIPLPVTMHYSSSSSPPPKPPPKLPSSRFDSPIRSSDHSSLSHGYVFSHAQLNQSKYESPPEDQISHSYVFSSSPDVNPVKPSSPPLPEAAAVPVSKVGSETQDDEVVKSVEDGVVGRGGSSRRRANFSISGKKREVTKRKTLLGFRFFGLVFCLASFSIMAADKNQGWALDSFHRYKEFRYCMSVNVMGFAYSGLQVYDLANSLAAGKLVSQNQLRYYLDFSLDQAFVYILKWGKGILFQRMKLWGP